MPTKRKNLASTNHDDGSIQTMNYSHNQHSSTLLGDELVPIKAFDIFEPDKKQISTVDTFYCETLPSFTFSDSSNIVFELPASNFLWTSPEFILNLKLKIQRKKETINAEGAVTSTTWENIPRSDTHFTLSMLPLHSCFSDVILYLNNEQVTPKHGLYPYLAYFQSYFLTSKEDRTYLEGTQLAYFDKSGNLDDVYEETNGRKTMLTPQDERRKPFLDGDEALLRGKLLIPFFCQNRYLLPGVNIRLELVQTTSAFRAIEKPNGVECKVSITYAALTCKRIQANTDLYVRSMRNLSFVNAQYHIDRYAISTAQIPSGSQLYTQNISLATSILPRYIFIMSVSTRGLFGDFTKNPFTSKLHNIVELHAVVENQNYPKPSHNLTTYEGRVRAYCETIMALNAISDGKYNKAYSFKEFTSDLSMCAISLERHVSDFTGMEGDATGAEAASIPRSGLGQIVVRLDSPSREATTLLIICAYKNKIFVNDAMNVKCDY